MRTRDSDVPPAQRIFHHPVDHYDFVIELNPALSTRYHQNIDANPSVWTSKIKYANAVSKDTPMPVMPGFDPVSLLFDDLAVSRQPSLCLTVVS